MCFNITIEQYRAIFEATPFHFPFVEVVITFDPEYRPIPEGKTDCLHLRVRTSGHQRIVKPSCNLNRLMK